MTKATAMLQANYGSDVSQEKILALFELIRDEGWSAARFEATVKWFIKTKRFPAWTIADWFDYGVTLYPHSWYIAESRKLANPKLFEQMDIYRINGEAFYRYKDPAAAPLPFETISHERYWKTGVRNVG